MKKDCSRILRIGGALVAGLVVCVLLMKHFRKKDPVLQPKQKESKVKLVKYGDLAKYYPMSKMGSFDQTTNNKRDWKHPENGTAVHPEINGLGA
jgi:hypothetical protein